MVEKPLDDVFPHTVLAVGTRPLCVWDQELKRHNLDFCETMDPEWFVTSMTNHLADIEADSEIPQPVALSVRLIYHHALETFFALLFSAFQAPYCLPAWLELYQIGDIRKLIQAVRNRAPLLNGWGVARPDWKDLSRLFNQGTWEEGGEETTASFAASWNRLATEFLDDAVRSEYNGLKHGFRARPSGGAIRVGLEPEYGVSPPPEEMRLLGGSKHGSSAFILEPIPPGTKRRRAVHVHMKTKNVLWVAESTIQKVQLLAMSMKNIIGAVRIRNGTPASEVRFHRFADADVYEAPWRLSTGVTNFEVDLVGPGEGVTEIGSEQLRARLRKASGFDSDDTGGAPAT